MSLVYLPGWVGVSLAVALAWLLSCGLAALYAGLNALLLEFWQ